MRLTQSVSMDFSVHGIPPRIYGKQDDSLSRVVEISLYQAGTAWTIPDSAVMMLHYRTPAGHIGIYDTLPDGSAAISASGNVVSAVLVDQIFAIPGVVECELRIIDASSGVSTWTFLVEVESGTPSTETIPSDYFNVLTALASQVSADAATAKNAADSVNPNTLMHKSVFDPTGVVEAAGGISKYIEPHELIEFDLPDMETFNAPLSSASVIMRFDHACCNFICKFYLTEEVTSVDLEMVMPSVSDRYLGYVPIPACCTDSSKRSVRFSGFANMVGNSNFITFAIHLKSDQPMSGWVYASGALIDDGKNSD